MSLDKSEIAILLQFVASVSPDTLDCDGCFEQVPELVESQLGNVPLSDVLLKVQNHLDNCPCCAQEYKSFVTAIEEIEPK